MGRAAARVGRRQTGPATQQAEQNALARLALVLEASSRRIPASNQASPAAREAPGTKARPAASKPWRS